MADTMTDTFEPIDLPCALMSPICARRVKPLGWMGPSNNGYSRTLISERLKRIDPFLQKYPNFEKLHRLDVDRKRWLNHWSGLECADLSLTEEYNKVDDKFKFLDSIWLKDYFQPFLTIEEAKSRISEKSNEIIVRLSSTSEETITITFSFFNNYAKDKCNDETTIPIEHDEGVEHDEPVEPVIPNDYSEHIRLKIIDDHKLYVTYASLKVKLILLKLGMEFDDLDKAIEYIKTQLSIYTNTTKEIASYSSTNI